MHRQHTVVRDDCNPVAPVLDPVENISPRVASQTLQKGHYRAQYRAAARDGIWGTKDAMCGQAVLIREQAGVTAVIPVLCDTWACKLCGPRKAAWLKRELCLAQERHGLAYFWTLTVQTGRCTPQESGLLITGWWDRLHRRLMRCYGRFAYLWILEHTKRGYAHLHLLSEAPAPQAEISAMWRDITGGSWVVDVEPVASDRAGDYLAKYCTQQARRRAEPGMAHLKGRRMFSKSQDVQFAPFRATGEHESVMYEDTGELVQRSVWRRESRPYWVVRATLAGQLGPPAVEQVQGVPRVEFRTAAPAYSSTAARR